MISKLYTVQLFCLYPQPPFPSPYLPAHQNGEDLLKPRGARHEIKTGYFLTNCLQEGKPHLQVTHKWISRVPASPIIKQICRWKWESSRWHWAKHCCDSFYPEGHLTRGQIIKGAPASITAKDKRKDLYVLSGKKQKYEYCLRHLAKYP